MHCVVIETPHIRGFSAFNSMQVLKIMSLHFKRQHALSLFFKFFFSRLHTLLQQVRVISKTSSSQVLNIQQFRIKYRLTDNLSTSIVNSSCNCLSSSLCKIHKRTTLKKLSLTQCKEVDESRYYLDSFALPKITTKTMAHDENQAVTSSFSSSFLVSSLDFVSSFLSVAVSFSFFCSATGAMLESIRLRLAQTLGISCPALGSVRWHQGPCHHAIINFNRFPASAKVFFFFAEKIKSQIRSQVSFWCDCMFVIVIWKEGPSC